MICRRLSRRPRLDTRRCNSLELAQTKIALYGDWLLVSVRKRISSGEYQEIGQRSGQSLCCSFVQASLIRRLLGWKISLPASQITLLSRIRNGQIALSIRSFVCRHSTAYFPLTFMSTSWFMDEFQNKCPIFFKFARRSSASTVLYRYFVTVWLQQGYRNIKLSCGSISKIVSQPNHSARLVMFEILHYL